MSPIPSVVTAFAPSPVASPLVLDPDSSGQSAPVMSQHVLGTGGLLFAVVAIVSIAGYFYHGRGAANSARTSNALASLSSFLSSIRPRGSVATSTAPATDWHVDLEVGFERHVSMVYARFFHPTFWNLVECHPATPSTPAIYVEDETNEIPVSDPKPPGMSSFLDMDDDDDDDEGGDRRARKKPDQCARPRVEELPPYDMSSPTSINFSSVIIGTTVRSGAFLSVSEELEDDSTESSSSDSELDFSSAYDGIMMSPPKSLPGTRRYGMADMAYFSESLKETIPEGGCGLVPTISHRSGLLDISKFAETDPAIPVPLKLLEPVDDTPAVSDCESGVQDSRDGWSDADTLAAPDEGLDLMRRLLAELRDPNLDCSPRSLSEDSDSEYDDDEASIPQDTPPWRLGNVRRNSLESTCSSPRTDSDASDEGSIYPLTPPSKLVTSLAPAPDIDKTHTTSPVMLLFKEEVQVMSPTSLNSPPSLPTKAYVRTHRDSRSVLYGPRLPLAALPRL